MEGVVVYILSTQGRELGRRCCRAKTSCERYERSTQKICQCKTERSENKEGRLPAESNIGVSKPRDKEKYRFRAGFSNFTAEHNPLFTIRLSPMCFEKSFEVMLKAKNKRSCGSLPARNSDIDERLPPRMPAFVRFVPQLRDVSTSRTSSLLRRVNVVVNPPRRNLETCKIGLPQVSVVFVRFAPQLRPVLISMTILLFCYQRPLWSLSAASLFTSKKHGRRLS